MSFQVKTTVGLDMGAMVGISPRAVLTALVPTGTDHDDTHAVIKKQSRIAMPLPLGKNADEVAASIASASAPICLVADECTVTASTTSRDRRALQSIFFTMSREISSANAANVSLTDAPVFSLASLASALSIPVDFVSLPTATVESIEAEVTTTTLGSSSSPEAQAAAASANQALSPTALASTLGVPETAFTTVVAVVGPPMPPPSAPPLPSLPPIDLMGSALTNVLTGDGDSSMLIAFAAAAVAAATLVIACQCYRRHRRRARSAGKHTGISLPTAATVSSATADSAPIAVHDFGFESKVAEPVQPANERQTFYPTAMPLVPPIAPPASAPPDHTTDTWRGFTDKDAGVDDFMATFTDAFKKLHSPTSSAREPRATAPPQNAGGHGTEDAFTDAFKKLHSPTSSAREPRATPPPHNAGGHGTDDADDPDSQFV